MKKKLRVIGVVVACVLAFTYIAILPGCGPAEKEPLPRTNIAPPALEPQPEPRDSGELITYTVSRAFSSDMVVQRNAYLNVSGKADQSKGIIYGEFMGEKRYARIAKDGSFTIQFSSHEAETEPQTLKIYPKNGEVTEFTDILVGDVWMISGQSNAEMSYSLARQRYPEYDDRVNENDCIRVFFQAAADIVTGVNEGLLDATVPADNVVHEDWRWKKTTLANVYPFSAIGYYFGKELSQYTDVPLGLVMAAAGGAAIQELMPGELAEKLGYTAGAAVPVSGYYNTLIHPFTGNRITGMLFYQGESESGGDQYLFYANHLAATVESYREIFGIEFPFINVQLSSHGIAGSSFWPKLPRIRAAQYDASKLIPNSFIVASMDQGYLKGDPEWAHPMRKYQIGYRTARVAAFVSYGKGEESHMLTPEPETVTWNEDGSVTVKFKNIGDGITLAAGDKIEGLYPFYSYGGKMSCTIEMIDSFTVKVVPKEQPYSIRYGMMQDATPEAANIMSSDGIPLIAFEFLNENYTGY